MFSYVLKKSATKNRIIFDCYKRRSQMENLIFRFRYSFICQGTSTRRQRRNLFGLRVKLAGTCY